MARALPLDMEVNLYRIAQEATANALRHSGVSHIDISVEVSAQEFLLVIQDDGCGVPEGGTALCGLGIKSMVSRAHWAGGELSLLPRSPWGTRVQVIVPLPTIGINVNDRSTGSA